MKTKLDSLTGSATAPCSGSFVRLFKPQFAEKVRDGSKLQTIRPTPKRMPKTGDRISLRCWTGKPYRSKQEVLREAVIREVGSVTLDEYGMQLSINGYTVTIIEPAHLDMFAWADGFSGWEEMRDWFRDTHGLPFSGVLIRWKNIDLLPVLTARAFGPQAEPITPHPAFCGQNSFVQ